MAGHTYIHLRMFKLGHLVQPGKSLCNNLVAELLDQTIHNGTCRSGDVLQM